MTPKLESTITQTLRIQNTVPGSKLSFPQSGLFWFLPSLIKSQEKPTS